MTETGESAQIPVRLRCRVAAVSVGLFTMALAPAALAYVGPGAGLGMLAALFAIIVAVLATVVGLLLWPLRMLARRRKAATGTARQSGSASVPQQPSKQDT